MISKEQAQSFHYGQTIHCEVVRKCSIVTGPRGGITEKVVRVRVSGHCQTWKTRPDEFRLPVKYGLRDSTAIDEFNMHQFHLPEDCPAGIAF